MFWLLVGPIPLDAFYPILPHQYTPGASEVMIKKPSIEILQQFSDGYFKQNPPKLQWHDGKPFLGCAVLVENSILLKPSMPLNLEGCRVDDGSFYMPKLQFQLKDGEQYFYVLLHEIGHFKKVHLERAKHIIPAEYIRIIKKLEKEYPDDNSDQYYGVESIVKRRKGETVQKWQERVDLTKIYITGELPELHSSVEDWARKEFLKRRDDICALLVATNT
jgi:hypothetical protein